MIINTAFPAASIAIRVNAFLACMVPSIIYAAIC